MSRRFPHGFVIFCTGIYFIYVNFGKKRFIFTSLHFKIHLINSNANSILYNFEGSFVHVLSFKALTQIHVQEISAWLGHFFAPHFILSLYKFRKNHHIHEPTVQKPFNQLHCKFHFVQLWRVYFTCLMF
jgi:hypothetical protein